MSVYDETERTFSALMVSRRKFLSALGFTVAGFALPPRLIAQGSRDAIFEKVPAEVSGISFRHSDGRSPRYYLPESTGAGCAFIDYDNDGWMDIYLVNSGKCDFFDPQPPLSNALFRNNRDGTFTNVTAKAGVGAGGYGMGVAVGDYDGDGFPDLFVAQYGRSILYHNNGDGTFTDVTEKSGIKIFGWASSAVWFDYDNDGRLDLFVCHFVDFDKSKNKFCGNEQTGERYYCYPKIYAPSKSWLFKNNGDGTFTDVSRESGIATSPSKAWGVVATDINNDGWMDLFVSNDTVQNSLFVNQKGKFDDIGLRAGVGYSPDGRARSGMGVDSGDFNGDGWEDLFVTNVDQEMYSIYRNNKDESFDDLNGTMKINHITRLMSGWGVKFLDYDNDGLQDLFIANGHPDNKVEKHSSGVKYEEPLLLFHNNGRVLENVSPQAGPVFQENFAARGLALGDFNNDGAVDVLVAVNNGAPLLLRNNAGAKNHWLGLRLIGKKANPDAIGARVTWQCGATKRSRIHVSGGGYLSAHDPRIVLGLGSQTSIDRLEIKWPQPSTRVDTFTDLPVDKYITIVEGQGIKT